MSSKDDNPFSETGIWNVAVGFSFDVLMYHIYWVDRYEVLSRHGAMDFDQEICLSPNEIKDNQIRGINWYYTHLGLLISNSKFAIKDAQQKKEMELIAKSLKNIKKYKDGIKIVKIDQKNDTTTLEINEKLFELFLNILCTIKERLFPVLYRANLVFQYKENYTPEQMKKMFTEKMENYG